MRRMKVHRTRRVAKQIVLALTVIVVAACENLNVGTRPDEVDAVKKIRSGQFELVAKTELNQLKVDADLGKSTGRYQIHREGFRVWRLDTATGNICLLLSSDADWKKPEIAAQGCRPF